MAGNQFLSILGWWFVPTVVAKLQSLLYSIFIRAGDAHPPPGSPKFIRHRKIIHALVIGAYLVYTIVEADWELQRAGDFYTALGAAPDASERALQSKFRRLTVLHHPDKIAAADARPQAERYYVYLTLARDTLVDPAKRFAYDRFGPDMLAWKHCVSVRDFVMHGVQSAAPSYAASAFALVVLGMLGYLEWGRYWRYLAFAAMLTLEAYALTRPTLPLLTSVLNPLLTRLTTHAPLLPYQALAIARKGTFASFIALSQLQPLLQNPNKTSHASAAAEAAAHHEQLTRLGVLARGADVAAANLLALETMPFAGDKARERDLAARLKDWLVQNSVRSDPVVRDALGRAVRRRREAPAGARGTT
ncbi:uncharacterized protein K452DRAFT_319954 [Aplosporella prunicola CBS 121167]|uniref:J domain-containing protein n=1 Tax=Aplosporella prunicola CBS 121167 TaxID=1176127 RepID=A0A6A6B6U3_9PEZI|nr:uncharacterized protein K452DRAFT_319954 [Aplosporella prunicola CBS 121167]KAF2139839.1 hypothetical protein K452DRAFT_319954 [Aplosporella prunicola CBS 121167]